MNFALILVSVLCVFDIFHRPGRPSPGTTLIDTYLSLAVTRETYLRARRGKLRRGGRFTTIPNNAHDLSTTYAYRGVIAGHS